MYQRIARRLTKRMLLNNYGNEQYFDIYVYGLECFLSTIGNIVITLFAGVLLGMPVSMFVYMMVYALLRGVAGGRHEKSHLKCIIAYLIWAVVGINLVQLIYTEVSFIGVFVCLGVSIIFVFLFAPIDTPNKRLSLDKKKLLKRRSRFIVVAFSICLIIIQVMGGSSQIVCAGTSALLVESLMLIPLLSC